MRTIVGASLLILAAAACASAQAGPGTRWIHGDTGNSSIAGGKPLPVGGSAPALGGPAANNATSRPLGGIGRGPRPPQTSGPVTAWPVVYVPSYINPAPGTYDSYSLYQQPVSRQPVIVNQYFQSPAPNESAAQAESTPVMMTATDNASPAPGYLIAYKNHQIISAKTYWMEDGILHYTTLQDRENQASLDLIDLELTKKLNEDQNTPFTVTPAR